MIKAEGKSNSSSYFSTIFGASTEQNSKPSEKPSHNSHQHQNQNNNEMSPNDIPKEELLQLCMKLNKKLQGLESKHNDLIVKYKSLNQERVALFDIVRNSLHNDNITLPENEDVATIGEVWMQQRQQERNYIQSLEEEIKHLKLGHLDNNNSVEGSETKSNEPIQSQRNQELEELKIDLDKARNVEKNLRNSIAHLELTSQEKNQRIEELEKLFELEKAAREEDLVFFRLQQMKSDKSPVVDDVKTVVELSETKQKLLLQRTELDEQRLRIEVLLEQTRQYEKKIFGLESDVDRYKEKLRDVEKNNGAIAVLKAEQEALLTSLRRDLKNALSAKEDATRHIKDLEEYRGRAEGQLVKLVEYKEKTQRAEESLAESQALSSRLQSQLQIVETNHALKTAMLATVESEIESLREVNRKLKLENEKNIEIIENLRKELQVTNENIAMLRHEKESSVVAFQKESLELKTHYEDEMRNLQEKHVKEIQDLMKEQSKKSATSTAIITEHEKEIKELRFKISSLKDEIASGSPSERKIFELAQSQANREATIGASIDTRDIAFQQLQNALASKDLEFARLQQTQIQLVAEITELRRISKREGVNMDYLKNIILQYMSFPPASPERNSLVPVLALLLQFSPTELKTAEEASRAPSWTSRPVKDVKISNRNGNKSPDTSQSSFPSSPISSLATPPAITTNSGLSGPNLQFNEV